MSTPIFESKSRPQPWISKDCKEPQKMAADEWKKTRPFVILDNFQVCQENESEIGKSEVK